MLDGVPWHLARRELIGSTLLNVRYCPDSDKVLDRTEMTRWAKSAITPTERAIPIADVGSHMAYRLSQLGADVCQWPVSRCLSGALNGSN